jgi:hypothetical protein
LVTFHYITTTTTDSFTQAFYEEEGPHAVHRFFY